MFRVWVPPVAFVAVWTVVQALPSVLVWIWYARAYAASHWSTTRLMVAVAPRSTRSHCGSAQALPHRVSARPSTAAAAGAPPFSCDEASAGRPCEKIGRAHV